MQSADRAHMVGINGYFKVVMEISKSWRDYFQFNKLFKLQFIHRNDSVYQPASLFLRAESSVCK